MCNAGHTTETNKGHLQAAGSHLGHTKPGTLAPGPSLSGQGRGRGREWGRGGDSLAARPPTHPKVVAVQVEGVLLLGGAVGADLAAAVVAIVGVGIQVLQHNVHHLALRGAAGRQQGGQALTREAPPRWAACSPLRNLVRCCTPQDALASLLSGCAGHAALALLADLEAFWQGLETQHGRPAGPGGAPSPHLFQGEEVRASGGVHRRGVCLAGRGEKDVHPATALAVAGHLQHSGQQQALRVQGERAEIGAPGPAGQATTLS